MMQYVMFGNTGMEVSRFALGAMTFGNRLDRDAADRVVAEALDHGVKIAEGPPEEIARVKASHTGKVLADLLAPRPTRSRA